MRLYLMRHGIAENSSPGGDVARALTESGKAQARKMLRPVRDSIAALDLIVSSPYLRAKQTAELAHQEFSGARMMETDAVVPHGDPLQFLDWALKNFRGVAGALVVSHEPYLGSLAGVLLCGRDHPLLAFNKAGIACFDWDGPGSPAQLCWFVQPQ